MAGNWRNSEIAGEYLRKGSKVYIEGSLRTNKWQDQNGQDRYTTEIIANEMQMLDGRGGAESMDSGFGPSTYDAPAPSGPGSQPPAAAQKPTTSSTNNFDDFDDDIPF